MPLRLSPIRFSLVLLALAGCGEVDPIFVDAGDGSGLPDDGGDATAPETLLIEGPAALSREPTPRFEFRADRPATFTCALDGAAPAPCTSPLTISVADGSHVFLITATTPEGIADPSPAQHAWRVDSAPPDTSFVTTPASLDNSETVRFEFQANEAATFTCALDGAAAVPCLSPHTLTALTDGAHTLLVLATDLAGNPEVLPASHAWTLDSSTPDTRIDAGPTGAVASTSARFEFSSPDAGAGAVFECALDAAAFTPCTSPRDLTAQPEGERRFRVRVRDATGNVDPTPAERRWTVDTVAPTVSIAPLTTPTRDASPTFGFTPGGNPTTVECRIGAASFGPCTTATSHTPSALTDGLHIFEVRVIDAAANQASATASVTIDTVAPTVSLAPATPNPTNDHTPTFTFTTAGSPASIQCRMGTAALGPCTTATSHTPTALTDGAHTVEVRVADAAGNTGSATADLTIDTTAPTVTFGTYRSPINTTTPTIPFTTGGNPTSINCRVDTAGFGLCTSATSHTSAALDQGAHTFHVRVIDAAGNSTLASTSVTVDTVAPRVRIESGPTGTIFQRSAVFGFTTSGGVARTGCRVYVSGSPTGAFETCLSPVTMALPSVTRPTAMIFEVEGRDAADNPAYSTWSFTIDGIN